MRFVENGEEKTNGIVAYKGQFVLSGRFPETA